MTAPMSVFSQFENNLNCNKTNMFSSAYAKILHDPECQNQCCAGNDESMEVIDFNGLNQYSTFVAYNTDGSNITSNNQNQFLYFNVPACSQVPEIQAENIQHELITQHSGLDYEKSVKRARYNSSINISGETRCKQNSYSKTIAKRKRKRTIFSTEQIIVMEGVFKKRPYVSKDERLFLSQKLNITEKAIKIWFQNRRRVTDKRDQSDSYNSDSTEEVCDDYNLRLNYIESQIRQNTDEYGFVTLNNDALVELVRIIDSVLSHKCNSVDEMSGINDNQSYLLYEPVSPESMSDDRESENISTWKPSKPEESLQRLIDIHTVLYRK